MAISFTCPFCNEAYNNLKEELIGKRVTCRNLNCRKIFVVKPNMPVGVAAPTSPATAESSTATPAAPAAKPPARQPIKPASIPKPNAPSTPNGPTGPVDAEALALAAFTEEVKKPEAEAKKIPVVCTFCDHHFEVDREMEGRNTPCPECRKLIKVPVQKKEEPVDWRKTENRDHLKKNEPVPEGVSEKKVVSAEALIQAGAVPKIEYEPLPLATKVKRLMVVVILVGGMAFGIFSLLSNQNRKTENRNVSEAIKAIETGEESKNRQDLHAGIYRYAAEERLRTVKNKADLDEVKNLLSTARQAAKGMENYFECQALLVEIAEAYCSLGGDAQELDREIRIKWDDVQKNIRQTLYQIDSPPNGDLRLQGILRVARKLTEHREAWRAIDVAKEFIPLSLLPEIAGQIGLELVKMGQKDTAKEFLRKKIGPMLTTATMAQAAQTAPSLTAFRIALGTPDNPAPLENLSVLPRPGAGGDGDEARYAWAVGLAYSGDYKTANEFASRIGNTDIRLRCFIAIGEKALADNAKEPALLLLEAARVTMMREGRSISPWLKIRAIYLLARAGKPEPAGELADALEKELQPWARSELLRGRLEGAPAEPAQEAWLPTVPENTKPRLAHAVAHERFARHQAANGLSYPVDALSPMLKPFAQLGTILGSRNPGTSP